VQALVVQVLVVALVPVLVRCCGAGGAVRAAGGGGAGAGAGAMPLVAVAGAGGGVPAPWVLPPAALVPKVGLASAARAPTT
jgi:hypothetical protein